MVRVPSVAGLRTTGLSFLGGQSEVLAQGGAAGPGAVRGGRALIDLFRGGTSATRAAGVAGRTTAKVAAAQADDAARVTATTRTAAEGIEAAGHTVSPGPISRVATPAEGIASQAATDVAPGATILRQEIRHAQVLTPGQVAQRIGVAGIGAAAIWKSSDVIWGGGQRIAQSAIDAGRDASLPSIPGLDGFPGMPGLPGSPGSPGAPGTPGLPAYVPDPSRSAEIVGEAALGLGGSALDKSMDTGESFLSGLGSGFGGLGGMIAIAGLALVLVMGLK